MKERAEGIKKHVDKDAVLNLDFAIKKTQDGSWMTFEELQFFFLFELKKMNKFIKRINEFKSEGLKEKRKRAFSFQRTLLTMTHFLIGGLRRQVVGKMETKYIIENQVFERLF